MTIVLVLVIPTYLFVHDQAKNNFNTTIPKQSAEKTSALAAQTGARTLIAYSRASAALLHWHLADKGYYIALPLPTNARSQGNHYQRSYPLNLNSPRPWLAVNEGAMPPQYPAEWQGPLAKTSIKISPRRTRDNSYWLAR